MSDSIFSIIIAVLGSGGFTALVTALIGANQRRKDRNDQISQKLDGIEKKLDDHIAENEVQFVLMDRARILQFADEISRKVPHSEESFTDILSAIDHYEDYCDHHKNFANSKATISIGIIKEVYKEVYQDRKFI